MSDGKFLRGNRLKSVLSRIKTRVGSDIASAISESTLSLTSIINSGDSTTLGSAKGYADGLKIVIDSNISTGDTNTLNSAKSYTDGKTQNKFELEDLVNSPVDVGDIIIANDQTGLKGKSSGVKLSNLASSSHTHSTSDITDVNSLAAASHTHTESDITDLQNYSLDGHTHTTNDISNFGNYANASHTHTVNDISDASTELAVKNHTHTESDITDLQNYSLEGHIHSTSDITNINDLATASALNTHISATNNPHQVTKSQIGLSNVDNTSDLDKPISTATQTALDALEDRIDLIDESGSSITLASLGGASATDLSNHTSDTNNPHSVTYTQTGAAPAVHSHTLSNITDVTATPTEVNYLSNSTKNIQTQINDCRFYGFFSEWEYEKEYHIGDVIKVPFCKPFIYLECIVDGISGYVQKLTIYNSNDDSIDQEYNYLPWTQQNSFHKNNKYGVIEYTNLKLIDLEDFKVGNTIIDGTTVWLVQDIRDGRLIGEVTYGLTNPNFYTSYNCYGIYPSSSSYNFFDSAFDCKVEMKSIYLKYIRFLKVSMMSIVLTGPNGGTSSKPGRFLNLEANTSLSLENGSTWTSSTPSNYGSHIVGAMVIMDWAFNPFTYLDSDHIDNIDPRVFRIIDIDKANNEFGATYTSTQYTDSAISLKHAINTGLSHGTNSFYLNTNAITQKYIRFGHYGRIYYSGLPNVTGNISSIRGYQGSSVANSGSSSALYWNTVQTSTSNYASQQQNITSGNKAGADVRFSASRTNSIYGNSTVVQPETVEFELIIKF